MWKAHSIGWRKNVPKLITDADFEWWHLGSCRVLLIELLGNARTWILKGQGGQNGVVCHGMTCGDTGWGTWD